MTTGPGGRAGTAPTLGLRANLAQFSLLVAVNALVGGMLGQERTVVPLLAEREFGLTAYTGALTFILAFGATKAATNYLAGTLSDRYGRKPVLIVGWLIGLPVPLLLIWAPSWGWVVAANVLLGINQGLTWSTTVIMKIDLVGPARRGLAMGCNEAAGYLAVAGTALATGYIAARHGLRPEPFYLGIAFAALGLGLSTLAVRETRGHARREAAGHTPAPSGRHDHLHGQLSDRQVFLETSFREPALSAASQAGMVNNLNDGLAWGLFPALFVAGGLSVAQIGVLAALYPAVWGLGQLVTGAMSDRYGRKPLIAGGMLLQAGALALVALGNLSACGPAARCCSEQERPWSTRPCSPPSATSLTPPGGPARSVSTGCGATAGSPSEHWRPDCSPTPSTCQPPSGRWRRSPPPPASSWSSECTRPTREHHAEPSASGHAGHGRTGSPHATRPGYRRGSGERREHPGADHRAQPDRDSVGCPQPSGQAWPCVHHTPDGLSRVSPPRCTLPHPPPVRRSDGDERRLPVVHRRQ